MDSKSVPADSTIASKRSITTMSKPIHPNNFVHIFLAIRKMHPRLAERPQIEYREMTRCDRIGALCAKSSSSILYVEISYEILSEPVILMTAYLSTPLPRSPFGDKHRTPLETLLASEKCDSSLMTKPKLS